MKKLFFLLETKKGRRFQFAAGLHDRCMACLQSIFTPGKVQLSSPDWATVAYYVLLLRHVTWWWWRLSEGMTHVVLIDPMTILKLLKLSASLGSTAVVKGLPQ